MAKSRKLHNRDRLSELPDSLIITILSFMEMRDAVRTTVLSKRWNDRWTTVPSLNFWCSRVDDLGTLRSFVNDVLFRWKGTKILRFDLPFINDFPRSRELDSWLLFAIGKQVEDLQISLGCGDIYYSPPQRLYTCSSIRKLTLSGVKLSTPENVQLSQLESLTVEGSDSVNELGMTRLLSGAPMLEELALLYIEIVEDFNIQSESLKKLQIQSIDLHSVMSIWAPNLSTLEIKDGIYGYGIWELKLDVPSLTIAILNFHRLHFLDFSLLGKFHQVFRSVSHAQSLTLSDWCTEFLLDLKRKGTSMEFSNAEHLQLRLIRAVAGERLLAVLEMFPKLLTLIANVRYNALSPKDGDSFSASEKKIDISLPRLKTCEITSTATDSTLLPAIEAVLESGEMLEKMVLRLRYNLSSDTLEKLMSMRRSSPKARVIISKYKQGL